MTRIRSRLKRSLRKPLLFLLVVALIEHIAAGVVDNNLRSSTSLTTVLVGMESSLATITFILDCYYGSPALIHNT